MGTGGVQGTPNAAPGASARIGPSPARRPHEASSFQVTYKNIQSFLGRHLSEQGLDDWTVFPDDDEKAVHQRVRHWGSAAARTNSLREGAVPEPLSSQAPGLCQSLDLRITAAPQGMTTPLQGHPASKSITGRGLQPTGPVARGVAGGMWREGGRRPPNWTEGPSPGKGAADSVEGKGSRGDPNQEWARPSV